METSSTIAYNATSIVLTVLTILTIVGGFLAMRKGWEHTTGELQKSVNELHESAGNYQSQAISALQAEIGLLRSKYEDVHQENIKLQQTITTICEALKMRDIVISIDGKMVSIKDQGGSTTTRISEAQQVNSVLELFDDDKQQFGFVSQVNSAPGVSTSQMLRKPGSILFKNQSTQSIEESDLPYQPAEQEQGREQVV